MALYKCLSCVYWVPRRIKMSHIHVSTVLHGKFYFLLVVIAERNILLCFENWTELLFVISKYLGTTYIQGPIKTPSSFWVTTMMSLHRRVQTNQLLKLMDARYKRCIQLNTIIKVLTYILKYSISCINDISISDA